jgi:hypothetical protein
VDDKQRPPAGFLGLMSGGRAGQRQWFKQKPARQ